jgi:hypothetical protein
MNTDMVFLIDTSAWVLVLQANAPDRAKARVDQLIAADRAASTGVIFLELLSGSKSEQELEAFRQELEALIYFPFAEALWIKAAVLYSALRKKGVTVPTIDALIATIAIENGTGVVHADTHFDLISQQTRLKSVNLLEFNSA